MQQDFEFWGLTPQAARPQIDNLLRTWCHLKLPVSLIFSPDGAPLLREEKGQARIKIEREREVGPRRNREQSRRALEGMLDEQPPCSLNEVACRLGYATAAPLRRADPAVCARIVTNYRRSGHSHWRSRRGAKPICQLSQAKKALEDHLRSEDRIPPLHRIAVSLGYANDGNLRKKFP